MKRILGKKQSMKNEEWIQAVDQIESLVSREETEARALETIEDIKRTVGDKKAAYAWSAGKDSLVLGEICRLAGITDCMMAVCELEYPAFVDWVKEHKPDGLEVINTGQDLTWLSKHQSMLFPQDSSIAARWFSVVQHKAQEKYYKSKELDMILLGRRRADGNYCGRGSNIYTNGKGTTRYSPLASWSHEEILAFIHYNKIPIPPIYGWKNGYLCGTHPWPARQWTGSVENGWKEIYEIDKNILREAAKYIESADAFLKKI